MSLKLDMEAGESRYENEPPNLCSKRPDEILVSATRMADEIGGSADMEEKGAEGGGFMNMKTYMSNNNLSFVTDTYGNGDGDKQEGSYSTWKQVVLAYQTLGVVFGGLATSPLYVYPSMNLKSPDEEDYLGILSLMLWTLSMIGVVKYVLLALRADDRGEGGTFALYSLLCRHANVGQQFGRHLESDAKLSHSSKSIHPHSNIVQFFERSVIAKRVLLFVAMLGTCMLIGDGILTPAISVLSAVQGLRNACPSISQYAVVALSSVTLITLFLVQKFGTSRVSFLFSPIMLAWVISTPLVGVYNIIIHYNGVLKAFSPYYIFHFFSRNGKQGWLMLGGAVLCITGAEAMFADLGHFNKTSIQMAFLCAVYPSLIITYAGQTAYLIKHPYDHADGFYKFVPNAVYWPMFVVSTLAAIVASQALISASFSVIKQSVALDYFPRVKLVHTSQYKEGQIYCPEINYILMFLCLAVILGFQSGNQIGNAFGVVVIMVMLITTVLLTLVMIIVWKAPLPLVLVFFTFFSITEGIYVSSVLTKVPHGGWLPFAVSVVLAVIMFSWNHGRQKKIEYEVTNNIDSGSLGSLLSDKGIERVPGLCFFYNHILQGVPPIVGHYIKNVGSLHEVIVLITFKYVPVKTILPDERFLVKGLGYKGVYRCIARYGYSDSFSIEGEEFVDQVIDSLDMYIKFSAGEQIDKSIDLSNLPSEDFISSCPSVQENISDLANAKKAGVVHVLGKARFRIGKSIGWFDRILLGSIYQILHTNCRSSMAVLKLPPASYLEIGMIYEI